MTHESKLSHLFISAALTGLVAQGYVTIAPRVVHATAVQTMPRNTATDDAIQVTANEFSNYFSLNQDTTLAGQPSNGSQLVNLTPDQAHQVGNFTLNNKIDMDKSFTLTGQLNLGNKSMNNGGADGVSIVFHPGAVNQTGAGGAATGFGGIPGAFGFKWDTYHNPNDPTQFTNNQSYAAFVHNDDQNNPIVDLDSAKQITNPTNNQFIPVTISYDGPTRMMTVRYGDQTFKRDLTNWIGDSHALALSMTASTGANFNLQQFSFQSFDYTPAVPKSHIKIEYQDANGTQLRPSTSIEGRVKSPFIIQPTMIDGYRYQHSSSQLTGNFGVTDQTIVLTYQPIPVGSITVHFVDQNGHQITPDQTVNGLAGDPFSINVPTIPGYIANESTPQITGYLRAGTNEATVTYTPITTHVKVLYQDQDGHQIQAPTMLTGTYLSPYSIDPATIANYQYVSSDTVLRGDFGSQDQTITLTYARIPAETIIHFVSPRGQSLRADQILTGYVGDTYQTQLPTITGYHVQATSPTLIGQFTSPMQEQTIIYQPVTTHVNISYLDQNGKPLAATQVLTGDFGATYQVQPIVLPGYAYIANSAVLTGTFGPADTDITLSYQRLLRHIKVVFMTNNHHPILPSQEISGYFGDGYQIAVPTVPGFTSNIKVISGSFDVSNQQILVTYTPIKAKLTTVHLQIVNSLTGQIVRVISLQGKVGERINFNEAYYLKILAQYGLQPASDATWPQSFVISNATANDMQLTFNVIPIKVHENVTNKDIINSNPLQKEPQSIMQANNRDAHVISKNEALLDVNNLMQKMLAPTDNKGLSRSQAVDTRQTNQANSLRKAADVVAPHKRTQSQQQATTQAHMPSNQGTVNDAQQAPYFVRVQHLIKTIQHKIGFGKADQLTKKMPVNSPSPSAVLPTMEIPSGGGGNGGTSIGEIMGALATSTSFGAR